MLTDLATIDSLFYLAAAVAVIASLKVVTGSNTVHALLYLVVSLLAVAVCFYLMGCAICCGLGSHCLCRCNISAFCFCCFNVWFG